MENKKTNGKLILKTLPGGKKREAVLQYLGRVFKNAPRASLSALVKKIPPRYCMCFLGLSVFLLFLGSDHDNQLK